MSSKPKMTAREWMLAGEKLHNAGYFADAERHYREVLALSPDNAEALHGLGIIAHQLAKNDEASAWLELAARAAPTNPHIVHNLGVVRRTQGNADAALAAFRAAVNLSPDWADAQNNLGHALRMRGDFEEAVEHLQRARSLKPDFFEAHNNIAECFLAMREPEQAIPAFERALALRPKFDAARFNLAVSLRRAGRPDQAIRHYRMLEKSQAPSVELYCNLAATLRDVGVIDEARRLLEAALRMEPDSAQALTVQAIVERDHSDPQHAIALFRRAVTANPDNAELRSNFALALLSAGELTEGWQVWEYRWNRGAGLTDVDRRPFKHHEWAGEPLLGKVLLVYPEQGIGDELWLSGMFGELLEQVGPQGQVVIECAVKLRNLFQRNFPNAVVMEKSDPPAPECVHGVNGRAIDHQVAAGSLPQFLRPALANFPRRHATNGAYLTAKPEREAYWKQELAKLGPGLKVGVCWRSSRIKGELALHCTRLNQWGEVLRVPGVHFVNLQYDQCEAELAEAESLFPVKIRRYPEVDMFDDLEETAALMRGLDLVIGTGTSVSILSAALGVRTWQLNYEADWQCHGLPHNPWYPSMRNYPRKWNQRWEEILKVIAKDLAAAVEA
jgi:tetratricopeptide (TPR) repeat protein